MRYVAFLRGINVGANNRITMQDLRAMFEAFGFKNVTTHIQSGNVLFDCDIKSSRAVEQLIENRVLVGKNSISVMVRSAKEMKKIVAGHPFPGDLAPDTDYLVTFLSERPDEVIFPDPMPIGGHVARVDDLEVYTYSEPVEGRHEYPSFKTKPKVQTTTRNWRVIQAIAGIL
ncbi:MAG: hypothetical protein QOJ65_1956 [Fimbriimonadaceae bacterium]|jgi:uncharacterized protein (DUF1697 family)|nr:hypothetical protein [Fimbriimonadaceae bacterium]